MTRQARVLQGTVGRGLWRQWLTFESAHPGAALVVSSLAVLIACGAVLATMAMLPIPEAAAAT